MPRPRSTTNSLDPHPATPRHSPHPAPIWVNSRVSKIRVYELAKEVGRESKELLMFLNGQGLFLRSASSTLEPAEAQRVREAFMQTAPRPTQEHQPMRGYAVEKLRVHELAAELGIEPGDLLPRLASEGHIVTSTFAPLEPEIVRRLRSPRREARGLNRPGGKRTKPNRLMPHRTRIIRRHVPRCSRRPLRSQSAPGGMPDQCLTQEIRSSHLSWPNCAYSTRSPVLISTLFSA